MAKEYVVRTKIEKLSPLNGYSCKSKSKDHFLRHLGYRFSKVCDMYTLNNAYQCGELSIDILKKKEPSKEVILKPKVINEYWDSFGYVLVIDWGNIFEESTETRLFTNDTEAYEWVRSHE